jgi:hypothetical protein
MKQVGSQGYRRRKRYKRRLVLELPTYTARTSQFRRCQNGNSSSMNMVTEDRLTKREFYRCIETYGRTTTKCSLNLSESLLGTEIYEHKA